MRRLRPGEGVRVLSRRAHLHIGAIMEAEELTQLLALVGSTRVLARHLGVGPLKVGPLRQACSTTLHAKHLLIAHRGR